MGLDMYAYTKDKIVDDSKNIQVEAGSLMYWRNHNVLHGWFKALWEQKGKPGVSNPDSARFNGVELELTISDILQLEKLVGENLDHVQVLNNKDIAFIDQVQVLNNKDIAFVALAKNAFIEEKSVYYNSSW